jgi:hypothetical protein
MRFVATVVALAIACTCGCTAHNPNYVGDGGGGAGGGGGGGAGSPDLAGGGVLDLSGPMGTCVQGERKCAGTAASDRCEGGMFIVDRNCPANSSCTGAYCAPPTATFGTQIGARCDANGGAQQLQCMASPTAMLSCQPFVEPSTMNLRWFCDTPVGAGRAGMQCAKGSDCRSGVCAATTQTCFDACQRDQDCQLGGGTLTCKSVQISVEGVTVTAKGCG